MLINSKYTKRFLSDELTESKLKEIKKLADDLLVHRNLVSIDVANDLYFYLKMNKYQFIAHCTEKYTNSGISSNFYKSLYKDVYTCYSNKFEVIESKMRFDKITITDIEKYKRNTGEKQKGDFKRYVYKRESTHLTSVLSYLARNGSQDTINYLTTQINLNIEDSKKLSFYEEVLNYIEKYGFERLLRVATFKRINTINRYKKPIEFKSMSFGGRTRTKDIISYNTNEKSIKKAFITLSWLKRNEAMQIPVKYSDDYHGTMDSYHKQNNDYEYVITFRNNGSICVNICIDGVRNIPVHELDESKAVGIDINCKHNLLALSDGKTYDYNRKIIEDITDILKDIDKLKEKDKLYKIGKKKQKKLDALRNVYKHSIEELLAELCKYLNSKGINHCVFEYLTNSFGSTYVKKDDLNFNRYVKELHLSSIKDVFSHICVKYGIMVSFVHPEYTSKQCSKCGCIHDDNRLTQEEFKCVHCGFEIGADFNSSINVRNRVFVTVLQNLLKQDDQLNTFRPKPKKREEVRKYLVGIYRDSQTDLRV